MAVSDVDPQAKETRSQLEAYCGYSIEMFGCAVKVEVGLGMENGGDGPAAWHAGDNRSCSLLQWPSPRIGLLEMLDSRRPEP